jgi:hypothetical protein
VKKIKVPQIWRRNIKRVDQGYEVLLARPLKGPSDRALDGGGRTNVGRLLNADARQVVYLDPNIAPFGSFEGSNCSTSPTQS